LRQLMAIFLILIYYCISNMNESNQNLLSRVKGASVASCENSNYSVDEETNSSEIKSANKVAYLLIRLCFIQFFTLRFQVSNNSYGCSDEKNCDHDFTCPLNNMVQQPNNRAPETKKWPKASITVYEPDMGVY